MTAAEFQAAGLYDPAAPDAPARLEFLEWLAAQGATLADMREAELRWGALGPRGRPCAPRRRAADPRRGGGALGHVARADRALRSRGRVPARRPRGAGLRPRDGGHVRELRGRRAVLRSGSAAALHPRARLVGRTHRRSRRLALPRQRRGSHRRARRERARARSNVRWRTIPSGRRSPAARDRVALGALVPRAFFRYAPGPVARDELLRGEGRATARLGLAERRRERVGTLSGGLQRRTELAKALLVGAELLLLDEPTSGLDPAARREFLGFLAELRAADGITIVLTTHDMEEAERCDRVAILDRGRLVALGAPEALRAQVGGDVLVVAGPDPARLAERVRARFGLAGRLADGALRLERERGHELVRDLIEAFPEEVRTVSYGKPTLDDVSIRLTGHRLAEA